LHAVMILSAIVTYALARITNRHLSMLERRFLILTIISDSVLVPVMQSLRPKPQSDLWSE